MKAKGSETSNYQSSRQNRQTDRWNTEIKSCENIGNELKETKGGN